MSLICARLNQRRSQLRFCAVMFGASIVSILGAGQTAAQVLDPISNTGEEFPATIDASMLDTSPFVGGQGTGIAAVDEGAEEAGPVSDRVLDMLQALEGVVSPVEKAEQEEGLAEVILGFDVRTRDYTTAFPASAVVLIAFDGGACSGFMIGTDTVATAGHCVHPGNGGSFYDVNSYTIFPGFDASVAPFGSCGARRLHSVTQWTNGADERVDFGAIKLDCTIGNLTGWFGFRANAGNNEPAIVTGYPDDKDLQQWQSSDKVRRAETWQLFYPNDTRPGNSGGPIWQDWWNSANNSLGPYAIGIHAYGTHGAGAHALYNHGTRLVPAIFDLLARWKNAP